MFGTPPGQASSFVPSDEGGFLVFVRAKLPLDTAKLLADLPSFTANVRRSREGEALNQWFRHEVETSLRDTPIMQRQKSAPAGPAAGE